MPKAVSVTEYSHDYRSGVESEGQCVLDFGGPPTGFVWLVDRIFIQSDSTTIPTVEVFSGNIDRQDKDKVDVSSSGQLDIADETAPIAVLQGETLQFVFGVGLSDDAVCTCRIDYRVVQIIDA